ncbi:hypothetical protein B0H10DRAFT_1132016, partial [Mycena sp. CBHHK59/15]
ENFSSSALCRATWSHNALSPDSLDYRHLFKQSCRCHPSDSRSPYPVSAKPYFNFDLEVAEDAVPAFTSYYTTHKTYLHLRLNSRYNSRDVTSCMKSGGAPVHTAPPDETTDNAKPEEGMWDTHTPVGQPVLSHDWRHMQVLTALVPITVLGNAAPRPVHDYLDPSVLPLSPVLSATRRTDVAFPVAHPIMSEEPPADTAARLMRSEGSPFVMAVPIPHEELEMPYPYPLMRIVKGAMRLYSGKRNWWQKREGCCRRKRKVSKALL